MKFLVTGVAGFIGFHLAKRLLDQNFEVVGIDNLNTYYELSLKYHRLSKLGIERSDIEYSKQLQSKKYPNFYFVEMDVCDTESIDSLFLSYRFDTLFHFAAQAGIIYSTENPQSYLHSNIIGFTRIIDCCLKYNTSLIYASSSSVYGDNNQIPFEENVLLYNPKNLYAKTKIYNEQLAQLYSQHCGLKTVGLRLFSVFGPLGRPDMAYMLFSDKIVNRKIIDIYGNGDSKRDYTYIDDVITAILLLLRYFENKPANNEIFNIGSQNPVSINELISCLEVGFQMYPVRNYFPARDEEIKTTFASTQKLRNTIDYSPNTPFEIGMARFVEWWKTYHLNRQ